MTNYFRVKISDLEHTIATAYAMRDYDKFDVLFDQFGHELSKSKNELITIGKEMRKYYNG